MTEPVQVRRDGPVKSPNAADCLIQRTTSNISPYDALSLTPRHKFTLLDQQSDP